MRMMIFTYPRLRHLLASCLLSSLAIGTGLAEEPELAPGQRLLPEVPESDDPAGWSFTIGLGGSLEPAYEGSEDLEPEPLPILEAAWRSAQPWGTTFFAGTINGVGVAVVDTSRYAFGLAADYDFGRDESDGDRLRGTGDIDGAVTGTLFGELRLEPFELRAEATRFFGGSDGTLFTLGGEYEFDLGERWALSAGVEAVVADGRYMSDYFSVDTGQARRSRESLRTFDADAGIKSISGEVEISYRITESTSLLGSFGVGQLVGDAADSPFTERSLQPSASVAIIYRF